MHHEISTRAPRTTQTNMPPHFFCAMQWFESESSSSSRKLALLALICLLAGRLMAEMSLNSLYSVHLDSSDEGTHSRGKRGRDPAGPPSVRREKQRERYFTHAGMVLCDSRRRAPEDQVFPASVTACLMDCICVVCLQLACMWAYLEGMCDS